MSIASTIQTILEGKKYEVCAEIGVWTGKTMFSLVKSLSIKEYYAVDMWKQYSDFAKIMNPEKVEGPKKVDFNKLYQDVAKKAKAYKNIKLIRKESIEASKMFENEYFDFIFIDANHLYEYVKADIIAWFPKVKLGGIIAGHDYDCSGPRNNFGVTKAVKEIFNTDYNHIGGIWWHTKESPQLTKVII